MRQARCRKPYLLFFVVPILLVLLSAGAQAQPAAGKAKVDRLVMGLILPYRDYWRPWIIGTPDHMIQHDPAFEWLDVFIEVVVDPKVVADWPFSGWDGGDLGHTWLIKACKQEQPCK